MFHKIFDTCVLYSSIIQWRVIYFHACSHFSSEMRCHYYLSFTWVLMANLHVRKSKAFLYHLKNFVYVLEKKQICWRKSRFPSNIQLGILPSTKFHKKWWRFKSHYIWFCFTNLRICRESVEKLEKKEDFFWERLILSNELHFVPCFILIFGKKSSCNLIKLALF